MQRLCLFVTGGKKLLIRGFKFHYVNFCPHSSHPELRRRCDANRPPCKDTNTPQQRLHTNTEKWSLGSHISLLHDHRMCVFAMSPAETHLFIRFCVLRSFHKKNLNKPETDHSRHTDLWGAISPSKPLLSCLQLEQFSSHKLNVSRLPLQQQ